jgi:hypothetical protein
MKRKVGLIKEQPFGLDVKTERGRINFLTIGFFRIEHRPEHCMGGLPQFNSGA